jgi:TonB family protein
MVLRIGRLSVVALSIVASGARGQTVVRRIGAITSGSDSIVVSASDAGLISAVAFIGDGIAPAIATSGNARSWRRLADSVEHQSTAAAGDIHFDPVPMTVVRGSIAYVRAVHAGGSTENDLSSVNGGVETSIALTGPQFDQLLAFVTQAASVTDSMTVSSGHAADSSSGAGQRKPGIYFEFQADRPARPDPDNRPPHFPDMLRSAHLEGTVLAQFVVDTTGLVELSTFKVLSSTHELFTAAVKDALPAMRFTPAEAGGMKVRQLVQTSFPFTLP